MTPEEQRQAAIDFLENYAKDPVGAVRNMADMMEQDPSAYAYLIDGVRVDINLFAAFQDPIGIARYKLVAELLERHRAHLVAEQMVDAPTPTD